MTIAVHSHRRWPIASTAAAERRIDVHAAVRVALVLFVASIPFDMPAVKTPMEIPTLTALLLLGATVLDARRCYRRIPAALVAFGVYLWVFVLAFAIAEGSQRQLAARLFINMVIVTQLFWVMVNVLTDPRALRAALFAFVLACGVRAAIQLLGIGTDATAVWTGGERVTVFGQNANLSAIILAAGLVAALGTLQRALAPPRLIRLAALPIALACGAAIIESGSRGGLLCATAGLATFGLRGATVGARLRNTIVMATGLCVLAAGAWRSDMMRHRLEESAQDGRLAGRELIYPAAIAMFAARPYLGWGPIENQVEIARRIQERDLPRRDAHNLLLELLTSVGVVGALPFAVGLALALGAAWSVRTGPAGPLPLGMLLAVLAGTISGTWIAAKVLWFALALAVAESVAQADRERWSHLAPAGTY